MSIRLKDTANITAKSASSATSATKATQDSAGQQINTTYIKGLSVNGRTITYTKGDGSTGTITTQDTNTDTNTTYTLSKNGSTITLTGSDGKTTSVTDSNTTYSTGTSSTAGLTKLYTDVGTATDGTMTQAAIKTALDGKAASSHTHNYAGSSSAGGAANSATKLATARTINGTNFDGSANITTANWGTARTLTIGSTGKSVNGSANVSWALDEIGARPRIKKVIDLSNTTTYPVDKWYPCLATIPYDGMHDIEVAVQLNSGVKPSWSTHQSGFTCNLHVKAIAGGWGTTVADSIVLNHSYGFASANPCSYSQLNNSSNAVLWLRGGGKYFVFTDWDASWSVKTASTEISGQTVAPATSCPSISLTKSTMIANLSGNATTATTLQTARTINGTSFNGSANITTANWGTARNIQIGNTAKSVNGSSNVSWSLSEIGALSLSGGTLTGLLSTPNNQMGIRLGDDVLIGDGNIANNMVLQGSQDSTLGGITFGSGKDTNIYRGGANLLKTDDTMNAVGGFQWNGQSLDNRYATASHTHANVVMNNCSNKDLNTIKTAGFYCGYTGMTNAPVQAISVLEVLVYSPDWIVQRFTVIDNGGRKYERHFYNGTTWSAWRTLYDSSNKPTPADIGAAASNHTHNYAGSSSAGGNANAAVKLATARSINGTNFDGTGNITTANWGTARTLTIGNTGKSVNGSGNVSWSLSEIGALPLTGGTLSGRLTANGRISAPTAGSSWISGMTVDNATIGISTQQSENAYHPVLAVKTSGNHVANIGGIGNDFGFYGFKSGRTENGTDWSFKINAGTGAVSSTGNITAPTFVGALSGNASTATKATQDSAGQQINKTYIKGLSVNGKTITYTKGDGTTGTITTQDTNTTYSVGTASALGLTKLYTGTGTATDGTMTQNAIKTALDGKAASNHTHSYLPLSGGTVTGQTIFNNYLTLNAWSGYGTGTAQMWYDGNAKTLNIQNATGLKVGSNTVYHSGNFNPNDKADKSTLYSSWNWDDFNWRINNHHGLASMTVVQGGNANGLYEWGAGLTFGGTNSTAQFYSPHVGEEMYWRSKWSDAPVRGWHRIWHSGNMAAPHWGTGAPNNSDGRPDGTVYYRYA